jgi:hypothetical protein
VVHERKPPVAVAHDDLVAQNDPGGRTELLDVGAAQPAGENLERGLGRRNVAELRPAVRV